jgi:hypothetical protein
MYSRGSTPLISEARRRTCLNETPWQLTFEWHVLTTDTMILALLYKCSRIIYVRHFCSTVYGYDCKDQCMISRRNHTHSGMFKDRLLTKLLTEETERFHFNICLSCPSPKLKHKMPDKKSYLKLICSGWTCITSSTIRWHKSKQIRQFGCFSSYVQKKNVCCPHVSADTRILWWNFR